MSQVQYTPRHTTACLPRAAWECDLLGYIIKETCASTIFDTSRKLTSYILKFEFSLCLFYDLNIILEEHLLLDLQKLEGM